MDEPGVAGLEPPPPASSQVFGERRPLAIAYAELLADTGVSHGLIGPREVSRLWERHLLNCAVVEELIPHRSTVADIGSGAGLPGIPIAIARPDLDVVLVEPLLRRTTWLESTIQALGLTNVEVRRGKAELFADVLKTDVVTARAVTRLRNLGVWCAPLIRPGGRLLALKGATAEEELREDLPALQRLSFREATVSVVGDAWLAQPTTVVQLVMGAPKKKSKGSRRR